MSGYEYNFDPLKFIYSIMYKWEFISIPVLDGYIVAV